MNTKPDETPSAPETILGFADRLRAAREEQEEVRETYENWVSFRLSNRRFALPVSHVSEILRPTQLTGVPNAPSPVAGVMNLRGHVLAVVDTHTLLGLPGTLETDSSRVLVFLLDNRTIGLIVDEVTGLKRLQIELVAQLPASDSLASRSRGSLLQPDDQSLTLLDPTLLFSTENSIFN